MVCSSIFVNRRSESYVKQPKVIFFDIDGTLTSSITGEIPQSAIDALHKLQQQGIEVVAATGRPYSMCHDLEAIGFKTIITANGAYVRHHGEVLYGADVATIFQQQMLSMAAQYQHAMTFYCDKFYYNGIETAQLKTALHEAFMLESVPKVLPHDAHRTNLMCLIATDTQLAPYKQAFPTITFQRWHDTIVNVLAEPVSKSRAIQEVLNVLQYDKEQAIAFGDGYNDMDMLEYVGFGIAMENAPDAVKAYAQYVTASAHDDGIMKALQ